MDIFECSFRKLELFKYPQKKQHQTFLDKHIDRFPNFGYSMIQKFIINKKNTNLFLKDLKISIYNETKLDLYIKNKKNIEYKNIFDIVPLKESPHIKYLQTNDINIFNNYHKIVNKDPKQTKENKNYSIQRFNTLIKSILESNHNNYKLSIILKDKFICDGQHRASILYYYYGENYTIDTTKCKLY